MAIELRQLDDREQAVFYFSRGRTRSLRDPIKGLFRTHRLGISAATVDTDAVFVDRTRPVTFCTVIESSSTTPSGVIYEFGDDTSGSQLSIANNDELHFAAGDSGAGNGGIDAVVVVPSIAVDGARHHLVVAINPGLGQGRIWINGYLAARIEAPTPQQFGNSGVWAGTGDGAIGAAANGTSTARVTTNTAPSGFALVKSFEAYYGQSPRQFD